MLERINHILSKVPKGERETTVPPSSGMEKISVLANKGDKVRITKHAQKSPSNIAIGTVIEGVLDTNIQEGSPCYLNEGKALISAIEKIYTEGGKTFIETRTSIYQVEILDKPTPEGVVQPELGKFGVMEGDLERDGYVAFNSNHSSNQDAFAVNPKKGVYVVGDGLGSYAYSGAVSRFVTKAIAEDISDANELDPFWFNEKINELLKKPDFIEKYCKEGKDAHLALTTIAAVIRKGNNKFQIFALGDSPVYVLDKEGKIIESYKTENARTASVPEAVGFNGSEDKEEEVPYVAGFNRRLLKEITLPPGGKIILASDYVSDGLCPYGEIIETEIEDELLSEKLGGHFYFNDKKVSPRNPNIARLVGNPEARDNLLRNRHYSFLPWTTQSKEYLASLQQLWYMFKLFSEGDDEEKRRLYLKYKDDTTRYRGKILSEYFEIWEREGKRSIKEFLDINSGEEFNRKVTGKDKWKYDDATVIIVEGDKEE